MAYFIPEPDWGEGVTVERRFLTSVFRGQEMSETRKVLRDKPIRAITISIPYYGTKEAGIMWAWLRNNVKEETQFPWYPDRSEMTAANTTTYVYCTTEYRRFEIGAYAFLVKNNGPGLTKSYEVVYVAGVYADGLTISGTLSGTYAAGDAVYPAILGLASLEGFSQELYTDNKAALEVTIEETYSSDTLTPENIYYSPVIRATYPTLDVDITFEDVAISVMMGGDTRSSGRGVYQVTRGVPYIEQTVKAFCATREECWNTIGFFNHLRGRGKPFWMRSELDFLSIVSTTSNTSFVVDNEISATDLAYLKYLWVVDSAGEFDVITVSGIAEVATGVEISLNTNSLADISTVRQAHAVRLTSDEISEEYLTDTAMLSTFTVQELQGI